MQSSHVSRKKSGNHIYLINGRDHSQCSFHWTCHPHFTLLITLTSLQHFLHLASRFPYWIVFLFLLQMIFLRTFRLFLIFLTLRWNIYCAQSLDLYSFQSTLCLLLILSSTMRSKCWWLPNLYFKLRPLLIICTCMFSCLFDIFT